MSTRPVAIITHGSQTDVGRERDQNQDSLLFFTPVAPSGIQPGQGWLYAVADGMGGYSAGEVASKLAVETLVERFAANHADDLAGLLQQAVAVANEAVYQRGRELSLEVMGTTLVCAVVRGDQLYTAHVGDSRAYLFRDNVLKRLTRDHSLVSEQIRQGFITEAEAQDSDLRSVITRALGMRQQVSADIAGPLPLKAGDAILLCTDGVCGYVPEDQILYVLQMHRAEPQAAADFLVEAANAAGGFDNATAVVLYVSRIEHVALESAIGNPDTAPSAETEAPTQAKDQPAGRIASRANTETITLPLVATASSPATEAPQAAALAPALPLPPAVDVVSPDGDATQTRDRLPALQQSLPGLLLNRRLMAVAAAALALLVLIVVIAIALSRNSPRTAPAAGAAPTQADPPVQVVYPATQAPARPVSAPAGPQEVIEYSMSIVPQAPLVVFTHLSIITTHAQTGVPSVLTVTFRTNATIVEPSTFSSLIELGGPDGAVQVELAPQVNFNRQEQVKIEVLAEEESAGVVSTWTVGTFGLPPKPGLRMRSRLITLISLKPTTRDGRSTLPVQLVIRWLGTSAIPGDFKPAVSQ